MCLHNRLTRKARRELLAKKPRIITVWKILQLDGRSEFSYLGSTRFTENRIHEAENRPAQKIPITYKPGFHCYITEIAAKGRCYFRYKVVRKFYIRKSWITEIGTRNSFRSPRVYVCKKITPDRSLLKG